LAEAVLVAEVLLTLTAEAEAEAEESYKIALQ
jgi:hypothetical protein